MAEDLFIDEALRAAEEEHSTPFNPRQNAALISKRLVLTLITSALPTLHVELPTAPASPPAFHVVALVPRRHTKAQNPVEE
jgi:hypothetical protein